MTETNEPQAPEILRYLIDIDGVPAQGTTLKLQADQRQLAVLAEFFALVSIDTFLAELTIKPYRQGGASVTGQVSASFVQQCVVTLEPVRQSIREPVDVNLMPADHDATMTDMREVEIDPAGADPPDEFTDGRIDVGAIALEHFALAIDPYPRKPGVSLDSVAAAAGEPEKAEQPSPFNVLNRLKPRDS